MNLLCVYRRKIADVLQEIQQYQNSSYCLHPEPSIQVHTFMKVSHNYYILDVLVAPPPLLHCFYVPVLCSVAYMSMFTIPMLRLPPYHTLQALTQRRQQVLDDMKQIASRRKRYNVT